MRLETVSSPIFRYSYRVMHGPHDPVEVLVSPRKKGREEEGLVLLPGRPVLEKGPHIEECPPVVDRVPVQKRILFSVQLSSPGCLSHPL